jgi:hypothetical protein
MYSLGIQCKRQNIPNHAFYSYSVLNRSLSYICNISFLEVHLERILRVFHQVKQWIGEFDNMEAKD